MMPTDRASAQRGSFAQFYKGAYHDDHATMGNRALHIAGTLAGLALIVASLTILPIWWALAFPIVHAVPGLVGHRLFERNAVLGDVRVFRGQYPGHWYMLANHIMTAQVLINVVTLKKPRRQGR
jgi:hypothetical protein